MSSIALRATLLACFCMAGQADDDDHHQKKPHILFIVADDIGWHDMDWAAPDTYTPNLAALRQYGTSLDNYHVHSTCSPTRSALMTGRYTHRYGQQTVAYPAAAQALDLNEKLLPQQLAAGGYRSHAVGKWHLGFCDRPYTPTYRGFESWYGYYQAMGDYWLHTSTNINPDNWKLNETRTGYDFHFHPKPFCGDKCAQIVKEAVGVYSTELYTARAVEIIKHHNKSEPLFLYFAHQNCHEPALALPRFLKKYASLPMPRRSMAAMLETIDESVGVVVDTLKRQGMWEDTILVFTTDNGGPITHRAGYVGQSNYPLRGGKFGSYDGGVRATAFISGRGIPRNNHFNGLMHVVDWYSTLSAAAGMKPSSPNPLDSISMWGQWDKPASPRTQMVVNIFKDSVGAVRDTQYKLLVGNQTDGYWSLASGGVDPNRPDTSVGMQIQLYDMLADPNEENEISAQHPDVVARLHQFWEQENATALFPVFLGPDGVPINGIWMPWMNMP